MHNYKIVQPVACNPHETFRGELVVAKYFDNTIIGVPGFLCEVCLPIFGLNNDDTVELTWDE